MLNRLINGGRDREVYLALLKEITERKQVGIRWDYEKKR